MLVCVFAAPTKPPAEPLIAAFVPRGGPVLGSTTVTIRGANLEGTQACRFGSGQSRPATVQIEDQPPSVLCTTPSRALSDVPASQLSGYDEPLSLSKGGGTWLNAASLAPESAHRTFMLGGKLTYRFYHSRTLGVEPVVGPSGSLVKMYASGIKEYGVKSVLLEGRCRFGEVTMPVLKVSAEAEHVTCQVPTLSPPSPKVDMALALNGQDFIAASEGEVTFEYRENSSEAAASSAAAPSSSALRTLVMLHDVGRSPASLSRLADYLKTVAPGLRVVVPDLFSQRDTVSMHLEAQRQRLCQALVEKAPAWGLGGGFALLGVGQGGLLARMLVQRGCAGAPEVRTLVSLLAPQQGVVRPPADRTTWSGPQGVARLLEGELGDPYDAKAQQRVAYAGYWHDPAQPDRHRAASTLLAPLNGESANASAATAAGAARLRALEAFVLVGSSRDEYIVPWQSSFFGFYADGEVGTPDANVVLLRDSRGYQEDRLGLRTLDERGALPVLDCRCLHYDFEILPDPVKVFINGSLLRHLTARW